MSDNIDGTPILVGDDLAGAGAHINDVAGHIADELHKLNVQLAPIAETWTGPAASYYQPLQDEWTMAAKGLFGTEAEGGVLGDIAAAMHVAWGNYSEAEWANVSTWRSGQGG